MTDEENIVESTVEEQSVDDTSADTVVKEPEKVYTQDDFTAAITKRFSQLKKEAIELEASKLSSEALKRAEAAEQKAALLERKTSVMELSSKTGISSNILDASGLSGEALVSFAKELESEKNRWSKSAADVMNNAARGDNGSGDWAKAQMTKLCGELQ